MSFLPTGDIYDKTLETVRALGLDSECIGGGRIKHDADAKKILVYGYSQVELSHRHYSSRATRIDLRWPGVVMTTLSASKYIPG
jgi:phosphohistidine phosphatase